jgi:hypothetical protein
MKLSGLRPYPAVDPDRSPVGLTIGAGAACMVIAGFVAAPIPPVHVGWRFAVIAVAVGGFAAVSLDQIALAAVTAMGFLIFNGFLLDRLGELSWHGAPDLWRLMLLVMSGAIGLAIGEAYRQVRDVRARWRVEAEWRSMSAGVDLRRDGSAR